MPTDAIRDTIAIAKLHEQQHGHMATLLDRHVKNDIHFTIQLPEQGATASLVDFIIAYIEHVPSFIDAARAITREANIQEYAEPFLKLAEDYFLKPPEIVAGHVGLDELMDEAYLAHRLIEEVNVVLSFLVLRFLFRSLLNYNLSNGRPTHLIAKEQLRKKSLSSIMSFRL